MRTRNSPQSSALPDAGPCRTFARRIAQWSPGQHQLRLFRFSCDAEKGPVPGFAADNSRILDSLSNLTNLSRSGSPNRIANSAEASIRTRSTVGPFVARRAVLVVA